MKNINRKLSFFLASLMLVLSLVQVSVSAETLAVLSAPAITDSPEELPAVFKQPGQSTDNVPDEPACPTPAPEKIEPPKYINGGIFFAKNKIKAEIKKYFANNTFELVMHSKDIRPYADGYYYYSASRKVAYYDYSKKALVAGDVGVADIYVYTKGGVPICKLSVIVMPECDETGTPYLDVDPVKANLRVGGTTLFTVTASDGKVYDDICFSIRNGRGNTINEETGEFKARRSGVVAVRAYSKGNPDIYGETLVYVGDYTCGIWDGSWKWYGKDIFVGEWDFDICDSYYAYVCGWIKTCDGLFIPVFKRFDPCSVQYVKSPFEKLGAVSQKDLFINAWGKGGDVWELYHKYRISQFYTAINSTRDCKSVLISEIMKDILG